MIVLALLSATLTSPAMAAELPDGWEAVRGDGWATLIDIFPMLHQASPEGEAAAVNRDVLGRHGAFRCTVSPSAGAEVAGIWFAAGSKFDTGFRCELGGTPGVGGFALRGATGQVLWEDKWAPWEPYGAYILEGIIETGRVRAQLIQYDRKTLISQSEWVQAHAPATARSGHLGAYTTNGIARFWGAEFSDTPLCPVTDDAPNKRRLAQGEGTEWRVHGTGNWMYTDNTRTRIRQYANTERAWAVCTGISGVDRVWQTSVHTHKGTGGAGMLVKVDEDSKSGFNCWLGGTHGAGGLMVYRNAGPGGRGEALWSSPQDRWHWDEDLVIRAETKGRKLRARLFQADGQTLIVESPWLEMTHEEATREGYMAFHTWKGSVEFWGFSEGAAPGEATVAQESKLGAGWSELSGAWKWSPNRGRQLVQTAAGEATCLETQTTGAKGTWRCDALWPEGTEGVGLLSQANADLTEGFRVLLTEGHVSLTDLAQPETPRWQADSAELKPGSRYTLEGLVQTDRIVVRVLRGEQLLAESPAAYVSDTNNERQGCIGFTCTGPAQFARWSFKVEE